MRITIITTLMITGLMINSVFAANANFKGKVNNKNSVRVNNVETNLDLDSDVNDTQIFQYKITNNDKDGFKVSFTSENDGQMRLIDDYDPLLEGSYVNYTISIERGNGGRLGADEAQLPYDQQLSSTTPLDILYNRGVVKKTNNAAYNVKASIPNIEEEDLLEGEYEDTVTVIISNL